MEKLVLSKLNLGDAEVLTRDQLKKVLGGGSNIIQTTGGGRSWQCCWDDHPEDCSTCGAPGLCDSGAFLNECVI